jgi:hypothetical protein
MEVAVYQVMEKLRASFYEEWERHFPDGPNHEPRPINPEKGHALSVCRWILKSCNGDIGAARSKAKWLAKGMFRSENLTSRGKPWRWVSVAKDPGHFFPSPSNPSRARVDREREERFDREMAKAAREAAPSEVGKAALEAIKGGG